MKKLLILSGKGGTGKTVVASSFIKFSKCKGYADCDVDAPNLHLVTKQDTKAKEKDFFGLPKANINKDLCINCGLCEENCNFNAIKKDKDNQYFIDYYSCEGCGLCERLCPNNAITMDDNVSGYLYLYKDDTVFSTAKLKIGNGNSGLLVSEVKKDLYENINKELPLTIIDGSPGIGCPVIASISGVDFILIVAEPSLSSLSDMKRLVKTSASFKIPIGVCVNKFDISEEITNEIKNYCNESNIDFLGTIPYDVQVSKAINENKTIADLDSPTKDILYDIYLKSLSMLDLEENKRSVL